jgi:hypothetical protein
LYSEKENFEEYPLNLEYAELSFPILNNYLVERRRPCPRAMVYKVLNHVEIFLNSKSIDIC